MTTTELSTSIPTPTARPEREMTLREMPEKYISTTAVNREMGMEKATAAVGRMSLRKNNRITTASPAPSSRFCSTVSTTM